MTSCYARFLALVALVMLVASGPVLAQTDYDTDGDNYIDVANLAQLNAMRWDLNGDGAIDASADTIAYNAAFPNAASGMGCAATCTGYELMNDLDFDENADDTITVADATYWNSGAGWLPIGNTTTKYTGNFHGNDNTISNLFISRSTNQIGFFGSADGSTIRNLSLVNANVTGGQEIGVLVGEGNNLTIMQIRVTGQLTATRFSGGLVGALTHTSSTITDCGAEVNVTVNNTAGTNDDNGGLVGWNGGGTITTSYATGAVVSIDNFAGGLVGYNGASGASGVIRASYATGAVTQNAGNNGVGGLVGALNHSSTVTTSYAIGLVTGHQYVNSGTIGGLVGSRGVSGTQTISHSYYDRTTSGRSETGRGTPKTTAELQTPTGYTGIYAAWNIDVDGDRVPDNPWNFGTSSQYPTLNTPAQREQVVDYDMDNDGLIDLTTLAQLNAIRYDLNGDGLPTGTNADTVAYAGAFPGGDITASSGRMGCPATGCTGYELMNNLDFDTNGDGSVTTTGDTYWNSGGGWNPIGTFVSASDYTTFFQAVFNGNGYTINNLFINRNSARRQALFTSLHPDARIESLGITNTNVTGGEYAGIIAGENRGTIVACYTTGSVTGTNRVGGLVATSIGASPGIYSSYSTASVSGVQTVGGIVGWLSTGTMNNSYATGLITRTSGTITSIGGLVGTRTSGNVTASYYDATTTGCVSGGTAGCTTSAAGTSKTTAELQTPTGYTGIYANWNVDVDSDRVPDNPWNFGTTSEYPTLNAPNQRVVDHDGDNDGLIDITTLAQLNAIRYDLNGDGLPIGANADTIAYATAFPGGDITASSGRMGCPSAGCTGYELMNNLDFDTDGSGTVTATDAYPNWTPIGGTDGYTAEFNGNSNTITNLTITGSGSNAGLFSRLASGAIRDLGLITPSVSGIVSIGPLAAIISSGAEVSASYVQGGSVTCALTCHPGGLVGQNLGTIRASYAMASVSSGTFTNSFTGGLIGHNYGSVIASYAASTLTATGTGSNRGGLVGRSSTQSSRVTDSYCDTTVSGASIPCIDDHQFGSTATAEGKTTAELQTPTGYTGIYANWNVDLDGDNIFDFPWKFGTSSQYPTLNTPSQRQVLREIRVSISSQSVQEGRQGNDPTPLRFTVQLHKASMAPVTVAYADAGTGTATSGTDYTALAAGTLTFAIGETSKTIDVSVIGDAVVEEAETVVITLSNPSPSSLAVLAVASATGTITDRSSTDPEPDPDTDPTFTEAVDPQSYYQNKAIEPLTLPEATDGNGALTYSLTDLPEGLTFDAETRELSGTPTEAVEKAIYTLTATDEDGDEDAMGFFLTIVANLMPSFGDAKVAAQAYLRKQEITSLTLPQASGGDEPLTYALTPDLPDGLKFDAETRVLSGTPLKAVDETTYTLTATDNDGDEATLMFTLVVTTDPIPIFGDTTIAAQGWQHREIESMTLPQATGGNKPLTYALTPELPEGLTFDAETRIVSGTPLEAMDEATYTLTATDGNGDEAHLLFTLEIPDLVPAFGDSTTIAAQGYLVNQEIASLTFPQASSGDGILVYILLPFLPEGLSFDPTTRTLSGMPTEEMAQATYTLSALDADGDTASLPFTLEVSLPSPDLNGDGNVNFADFLTLAGKFNSRLGQERYDPWCDLNGDGEIDVDDFLIFADSFGT